MKFNNMEEVYEFIKEETTRDTEMIHVEDSFEAMEYSHVKTIDNGIIYLALNNNIVCDIYSKLDITRGIGEALIYDKVSRELKAIPYDKIANEDSRNLVSLQEMELFISGDNDDNWILLSAGEVIYGTDEIFDVYVGEDYMEVEYYDSAMRINF